MQEKISQPPPHEIKIFEGKAPPNSWVSENIVKYYQVQSQRELLTDVLSYVHELQSQQLQASRVKPMALQASYVSVPDKGSASDISDKTMYNSTQDYVKTEIETLQKLVSTMKFADPTLEKELNSFLDQLKQMSQSFPHLTPDQQTSLNTMMSRLLEMTKQTPNPFQRLFWNTQLKMLESLMNENGGNIKDFQNEIKELKARITMLANLAELLQNIQNTLKAKPPNPKQLLELIENLQKLANSGPQLNENQLQALMTFFQQLAQFKNSKGEGLTQVCADALIQNKLSAFLQANPNATPEQVRAFLKDFLQQSNLLNSNLPFMKGLGESIDDMLDKESFPACAGYSGVDFAIMQNGKLQSNEGLLPAILDGYAPDPSALAQLEKSANGLNAATAEESSDNTVKIEAYQKVTDSLSDLQNMFGKSAIWAVGQSLSVGQPPPGTTEKRMGAAAPGGAKGAAAPSDTQESLPWQFEHAILDHYMPGQEAYLQNLAMVLYLDNNGAMFGNTLLEDMMGWDGAANTFSFSNSLHSANGDFSGSMTKAQQQLSTEKTACSTAINQTTTAINDIQKELNSIASQLKNPNLTKSQKSILTSQQSSLQSQMANLKVIYNPETHTGQLEDLRNTLNSIHIHPPTGKGHTAGKYFSITGPTGWQSTLGKDEDYVINGNPNNAKLDPPLDTGGLIHAHADAETFQTTYSDQGQNQQMNLQMNMTEIQQEWTVVSTALQLLNQMYMTLAQAIYKG